MVKVEFEEHWEHGRFTELAPVRQWLRDEFGKNARGEPKRWMISYWPDYRWSDDDGVEEFIHYIFYFRDERMVTAFLLRWA